MAGATVTNEKDRYAFPVELEYFGGEWNIRGKSYRQTREYAWKHFEPRLERFTYRYRAVFPGDSVSLDRLRDTLIRSRLWLARAGDFNDPFDSRAHFYADGNLEERRKRLDRLARNNAPQLSGLKRKKLVDQMMQRPAAEMEKIVQSSHDIVLSEAGIVCFADDPRNILSWAHYGASHKGVCFQFEVLRDLRTFAKAIPMQYGNDYPQQNWLEDMADTLNALYYKYSAWSYERERRILAPEGAHKWLHFDPSALTGLIIGCAATERERYALADLISEREQAGLPSIRTYEAVRDSRQYCLKIRKIKL